MYPADLAAIQNQNAYDGLLYAASQLDNKKRVCLSYQKTAVGSLGKAWCRGKTNTASMLNMEMTVEAVVPGMGPRMQRWSRKA